MFIFEEFLYCGKVLTDKKSLENQGIIEGVTIQVVKKRTKIPERVVKKYNEAEVQEIVWMFKTLLSNRFHVSFSISLS